MKIPGMASGARNGREVLAGPQLVRDAALLTGAPSGVLSIGVDGLNTTYRYNTVDQLIHLRSYAREMELRDTGNRPARIMRTRFT